MQRHILDRGNGGRLLEYISLAAAGAPRWETVAGAMPGYSFGLTRAPSLNTKGRHGVARHNPLEAYSPRVGLENGN
jgi:hypothetical protein